MPRRACLTAHQASCRGVVHLGLSRRKLPCKPAHAQAALYTPHWHCTCFNPCASTTHLPISPTYAHAMRQSQAKSTQSTQHMILPQHKHAPQHTRAGVLMRHTPAVICCHFHSVYRTQDGMLPAPVVAVWCSVLAYGNCRHLATPLSLTVKSCRLLEPKRLGS